MKPLSVVIPILVLTFAAAPVRAVDEAAAMDLIKSSKCSTCHSIDKDKDGPSFRSVAEKYRGDPEAEAKLIEVVSKPHMVEIDGEEEEHGLAKTRDAAKISNLVQWILSQCQ